VIPNSLPGVLALHDQGSALESVVASLQQGGYAVLTVRTTDEAIGLFLGDGRLGGPGGSLLLAELHLFWPQTAAVILTSYDLLEASSEPFSESACDYVVEPCPLPVLHAAIARALERAALARALRAGLEELDEANAQLRALSEGLQERVDAATAELRRKIDQLDEAGRRLAAAQRQREEFISMIAHDLCGPLSAIAGYAPMLGNPDLSPEVGQRARAIIRSETRRMARLVEDLDDAAHLVAGHFLVAPDAADLVEIVREQVELAQAQTRRHAIRLAARETSLPATCDADRIAQVVANLLSNAIKHTPGGDVDVELGRDGEEAWLSVSDHGPGIPADHLGAIFDPGVRAPRGDGRPAAAGRGLGLYIARGVVEAHGGRISAENLASGARLLVRLPLAPPAPRPTAVRPPKRWSPNRRAAPLASPLPLGAASRRAPAERVGQDRSRP
jgi:signal transduction histidine kinase